MKNLLLIKSVATACLLATAAIGTAYAQPVPNQPNSGVFCTTPRKGGIGKLGN